MTRTEQAIAHLGLCHMCNSSSIAGLEATLDDQLVLVSALGQDAVVIARGKQISMALPDGRGTSSYSYGTFEARSSVVGPIEWIDARRGRIGVLGQHVQGLGRWVGTRVPSSVGTAASASLAMPQLEVGQRVRVFGFDMDGGIVTATGVHPPLPGSPDRVTGTVSRIDLAARRLTIGRLDVDYSTASLDGFPDGEVRIGDRLEAVGRATASPVGLQASRLVYRDAPIQLEAGTLVSAYGQAFRPAATRADVGGNGATLVRIAGQAVPLGPGCRIESGNLDAPASLRARVSSTGSLEPGEDASTPCRLQADIPSVEAYVSGPLRRVAPDAGEWRVLDVALQAQAATAWLQRQYVPRAASEFRDDELVQAGVWSGTEPGLGIASYFVREVIAPLVPPSEARFEGWMTSPAPNQVSFLGRPVTLDAQTRAGLRDCSMAFDQPLTAIDAFAFTSTAFTRLVEQRWITVEVALDAGGAWRAVKIETWNSYYCD